MGLIKFQPRPHVPPIGFFEPISADPEDMMTDVEFLLGVVKKLNEIIFQVNNNTEFIEKYTGKIEEIEAEIADLREEMTSFENQINQEIIDRFSEIKIQLAAEIALTLTRANAYTDAQAARLEEEIRNIALGQIELFDPTTGTLNDLQTVIDNIYSATREEAITASEYDTLALTATAYDDYQITAFNYDRYGRSILTNPYYVII